MNNAEELCFTPATEVAEMIRQRKLSPIEVTEAVLARIEEHDSKIHAFITVDTEGARASALRAEAAVSKGEPLGRLHGVPVSIKDLEVTKGLRTTFGTKFFEDNVPAVDGIVTERLRREGAVILGKTNTPAWGHKDMSDNLLMLPTANPWSLDRTAGGSSGGAAAAAAMGFGPLAHGTDGAGSIRIPAALCGVFGFKPSFGRVPFWPSRDLFRARSHPGPITRTVPDACLMLSVMAGPDARDPLSIDDQAFNCVDPVEAWAYVLPNLRVAWCPTFGDAPVDPEVHSITEAKVKVLESLGCRIEETTPTWDDPGPWHSVLYRGGIAESMKQRAAEHPEWIDPSLQKVIEEGSRYTKSDYLGALSARTTFYDQAQTWMADWDVLVSPAMPCEAWSKDGFNDEIGGHEISTIPGGRWAFMFPFNLLGWPAASLPCGFTSGGLPVGIQVVTGWHQDVLCLQVSRGFESASPWADQRPG